ncbi:MAG: tyrosine--tRNA ligase [Deltaproteobacteria bacterium]|jgi:tyrosyl-tRNA synthetase|nr:tyrosine--tRNA ligase [Deltaproteobacteria bacterium]
MIRQNAYNILQERGFIYQSTADASELIDLFDKEEVVAYIGFDLTADSLHVGHLLPLVALSWLERTGHKPIALMGGGTSMVGDPSGRTEARKLMTLETIASNLNGVRTQVERLLSLKDNRALLIDNSQWLCDLNYLSFLREIGSHFSVNRMLTAECYKSRLEEGLSFLEFNYMVMQAYDFLTLYDTQGNKLQLGGQDQWGNIIAGVELIRRLRGAEAYGLTMPLLIDPKTGDKFGKTNSGAVWLSPERTSVYDFYQFWRNVDDQELGRLLQLFTFLPHEECKELSAGADKFINRAKEILAYEVTALCHGHEAASEAYLASLSAFGPSDPQGLVKTSSKIAQIGQEFDRAELPTVDLTLDQIEDSDLAELFVLAGLASSKGEARRLIRQGGAYLDNQPLAPSSESESLRHNQSLNQENFLTNGRITLRAGKKRYKIIRVSN